MNRLLSGDRHTEEKEDWANSSFSSVQWLPEAIAQKGVGLPSSLTGKFPGLPASER